MKLILFVIMLSLLVISGSAQVQTEGGIVSKVACKENPDGLYKRQKVLETLVETLSQSVPEYSKYYAAFRVKAERGGGFFIYDLTDTSNKQLLTKDDCVTFLDKHVYHFAPVAYDLSRSHILFLEGGQLKIFKSVNCPSGDKIEDVIKYLSVRVENDKNKNEIIDRVKNYREYGIYWKQHADTELLCQ